MTVYKRRKNIRQRGSHTHGWGAKKKHRGAGNRGGRGLAGTGKRADHKKQWAFKIFGTGYFGKRGFISKSRKRINATTIAYIEKKLNKLLDKKIAVQEKDVITIDFKKTKFNKLLSTGNPTHKYNIIIPYFSSKAKEKIEQVGGSVVNA